MKIKIHITDHLGLFNAPVTVRKSERLQLEIDATGIILIKSAAQTIRKTIDDGKANIDLIDIQDGQYDILLQNATYFREIPIGKLIVSGGQATVCAMNPWDAVMLIARALDDDERRIKKNELDIKRLKERNKIDLG